MWIETLYSTLSQDCQRSEEFDWNSTEIDVFEQFTVCWLTLAVLCGAKYVTYTLSLSTTEHNVYRCCVSLSLSVNRYSACMSTPTSDTRLMLLLHIAAVKVILFLTSSTLLLLLLYCCIALFFAYKIIALICIRLQSIVVGLSVRAALVSFLSLTFPFHVRFFLFSFVSCLHCDLLNSPHVN